MGIRGRQIRRIASSGPNYWTPRETLIQRIKRKLNPKTIELLFDCNTGSERWVIIEVTPHRRKSYWIRQHFDRLVWEYEDEWSRAPVYKEKEQSCPRHTTTSIR